MRERGTVAFRYFAEERNRLLGLTDLVMSKLVADTNEDLAQITGHAPPEKQRPLPSSEELADYKEKQARYRDYLQLALELAYCRVADSYERYVEALIREILTLHPPLRTSPADGRPISLQVEREVGTIRGQIQERAAEIGRRYRIVVFANQAEGQEIARILEIRHVFTHNHGLLDHRAIKRLGLPESQIGVRLSLEGADVGRAIGVVSRSAEDLDERAVKRFPVPLTAAPPLRRKA
jgi:hypothetical protein